MGINIVSQLFSRLGVVCENLWSPNWIISPMFWSPKKSKCVWSQQIPGSSSRETTLISINLKPPKPWIQFPKTTVLSYVFQVGMVMPIYPKNHKTSNMLVLRFQPARSKKRSHWPFLWRLPCWFFGYKIKHWQIKHWHSWHSCHKSCLSNISSSNSDQTWMFPKIMVPPKSSILIGVFHYFHHPFGGFSPCFWKHFTCLFSHTTCIQRYFHSFTIRHAIRNSRIPRDQREGSFRPQKSPFKGTRFTTNSSLLKFHGLNQEFWQKPSNFGAVNGEVSWKQTILRMLCFWSFWTTSYHKDLNREKDTELTWYMINIRLDS